ncbi:MAG TPA: outer membrane beta-barrel protein [Stellaceae bacterium]|nr:outer membrane beta-barrel protein [Stellaceae bacterium]
MRLKTFAPAAAACIAGAVAASAQAQTPAPAAPPPAAPAAAPAPTGFWDSIKYSGHLEAGISGNPDDPANHINFGQLFTDRANFPRINQIMANVERDLDPKNPDFDVGFKFTGMYGTDSRITHFYNELDRVTRSPYQWDIVEADVQAHVPLASTNGIDLKLGQYPTPLGAEVIDATGNPLYSHTYIFNYGLPFKHTGALATFHVNDTIDLWGGIDTGVNDSIGQGMNNDEFPKALFGFGLNGLVDGNLTILALAHIGPENPVATPGATLGIPGANNYVREYYDVVVTYKFNDNLTSMTEFNRIHDDYFNATAGGVAQYLTYTINDQWSVTGRAEAFADQSGSHGFCGFVAQPQRPLDYVDGERGLAFPTNDTYCANSNTGRAFNAVYGALTLGATYKPPVALGPLSLMLRPEVRYDQVIGGSNVKPFDINASGVGTKSNQFTIAMDAILAF